VSLLPPSIVRCDLPNKPRFFSQRDVAREFEKKDNAAYWCHFQSGYLFLSSVLSSLPVEICGRLLTKTKLSGTCHLANFALKKILNFSAVACAVFQCHHCQRSLLPFGMLRRLNAAAFRIATVPEQDAENPGVVRSQWRCSPLTLDERTQDVRRGERLGQSVAPPPPCDDIFCPR
jgi:hypothetical protein